MLRSLKETNFHGTPMFPLQIYSHKDKNGFYSVTAHWHEELEFLYMRKELCTESFPEPLMNESR